MLLLHKHTRKMAIANGMCVSFCNQPKAQFSYLRRVTPVCRCLHPFCVLRHLATARESTAHFGFPGYATGTIAVNVTWMKRGFNACQTHRSMYASIFNSFPVIQPVISKVRHFSTFWPPWVRPGDNCGKCYMDGKRIQCWSNALQHIPIYLQPFTSYSEISVGNCNFSYPLAFNAPVGGVPIWIPEKSLVLRKLESWGYQAVKRVWRQVEPFRHITSVWRRDRQTDEWTDRCPAYSYNVRSVTDALKNH